MGIARGGAPRSRLAVYKVCWSIQLDGRCTEADILAAFDDALHDGVHVISASFGGSVPLLPFFVSSSDIGSFHATQLGISVVFSGGNDGVEPGLVQNVSPWGICVAASSIDRTFPTQLIVDNNFTIMGGGFNDKKLKATLVYGSRYFNGGSCNIDNWNSKSATGKIILCFSTVGSVLASEASMAAFAANASALIFVEPMTKQISEVDIIPVIRITIDQGTQILHYIAQSPKDPTVLVEPSKTTIAQSPAPTVAYFSSRGPSSLAPDILKPDITAPGINILAAWPPKSPPTLLPIDLRSVNWNFQSGTSMSCPHVSGVVALLKSAHPDWSPAAIKSALMTTAETKDISGDDILGGGSMKLTDPFDIGAGHINPVKALDPGLVYDMSMQDYVVFLCNIGYNEKQIKSIVGRQSPCIDTSCPKRKSCNAELNFPSITVSNLQHSMMIKRTVRNVGHKNGIYFVKIVNPRGVDVEIWPRMLIFSSHCTENSYYVTIKPKKHSQGRFDFGDIVWSDGHHYVRIPLVVCVNNTVSVNDSSTHVSI
ncbi:Subtilisin-like protease [Thalictrum thalictroides]|uniref:Subtilisin-like protease n=1 Tax=Thalictrum thalictroides TaxID=46969 RepID=A0A7J6W2N0_THATH|nr:Subtilisin-like protease [Thalictrum thalictroides]